MTSSPRKFGIIAKFHVMVLIVELALGLRQQLFDHTNTIFCFTNAQLENNHVHSRNTTSTRKFQKNEKQTPAERSKMKTTSERKHADWFPSSNMPKCLLNVQSGACASEQKHPGGRSRLAAMFNSVAEFAFRGCAAASPLPLSIRPPCQKESTVSLGRGRGRSLSLHLWVAATHLGTVGGLFPRGVSARACVGHLRDFKGFPLLPLEVSLQNQQQHGSNRVARLENKRADRVDVRSRTCGTPKHDLRQLGTSVQM